MGFNEHYLWASMFWGAIATGYFVYGWKQRSLIPFVAGLVMLAASILISSALLMSLTCVVAMVAAWWLLRRD